MNKNKVEELCELIVIGLQKNNIKLLAEYLIHCGYRRHSEKEARGRMNTPSNLKEVMAWVGSHTSEKKKKSSKENGKRGGRPKSILEDKAEEGKR